MAKDMVAAFTSTSVAKTLTAMTSSPYAMEADSVLKEAWLSLSGDAVTTLIEGGYVKLSSKAWAKREIIIPFSGPNLRTAPCHLIPLIKVDNIDLPCPAAAKIVAEIINVTGATPVTPQFAVFLVFEN